MKQRILTPEERLNAAIRLENVDRVPCAPFFDCYAARFAGISNYEYIFDSKKAFESFSMIKKKYPVWDVLRIHYNVYHGPILNRVGFLKSKIPGIDLPGDYEFQFEEYESMERKEYSLLIEEGFDSYIAEFYKRVHGTCKEEVKKAQEEIIQLNLKEIEHAERLGQVHLYGAIAGFATDVLLYTRSFREFIRDVYQIPDTLEQAISIINDYQIEKYREVLEKTKVKRVFIGVGRVNSQYFSLSFFERFIWPYLKKFINSFLEKGITPFLHIDGDWIKNLPYFLELPKGAVVIELDGDTDIFAAKRILGDHICIMGDVPSTMFVLGTSKEVNRYCKRLIDEIGAGGGFILGSGCTVPYLAKHSNVKAFFDSVLE